MAIGLNDSGLAAVARVAVGGKNYEYPIRIFTEDNWATRAEGTYRKGIQPAESFFR